MGVSQARTGAQSHGVERRLAGLLPQPCGPRSHKTSLLALQTPFPWLQLGDWGALTGTPRKRRALRSVRMEEAYPCAFCLATWRPLWPCCLWLAGSQAWSLGYTWSLGGPSPGQALPPQRPPGQPDAEDSMAVHTSPWWLPGFLPRCPQGSQHPRDPRGALLPSGPSSCLM